VASAWLFMLTQNTLHKYVDKYDMTYPLGDHNTHTIATTLQTACIWLPGVAAQSDTDSTLQKTPQVIALTW
jgi:hypothetical protein